MTGIATAIRRATLAAARLQKQLGLREKSLQDGGRINVFDVAAQLDVPLLIKPLEGLLGAYILDPAPGILVTTRRPLSVQRFTAAHELGHYQMKHELSFDDEDILRRGPFDERSEGNLQEVEANAFAAAFLLPRWLIDWHCAQQGWDDTALSRPETIYQMALRVGTSYEATCWTLQRYGILDLPRAKALANIKPRAIKEALLGQIQPENFYSDVWLLTERDAGVHVEGGVSDFLILRLQEHSGAGYMWEVKDLVRRGFNVVEDSRESVEANDAIGGPVVRRVVAQSDRVQFGELDLAENRPWLASEPINTFKLRYELVGPESEGWSRAERRRRLEAA